MNDVETILSEDFSHGQVIEGVRVVNPFLIRRISPSSVSTVLEDRTGQPPSEPPLLHLPNVGTAALEAGLL